MKDSPGGAEEDSSTPNVCKTSDKTRLQKAPVSSVSGCFYLPFDEAGGGVGGCAAI